MVAENVFLLVMLGPVSERLPHNLFTHTPFFTVCGAPPPVPEGEQNNKWLEKMLTLKLRYVHFLTATDVP